MTNLKTRFLKAIDHVIPSGVSAAAEFDRLRASNPDAFPVPRGYESFYDACAEVVRCSEAA